MQRNIYPLTWDDFDAAIASAIILFDRFPFSGVYGVPRGGLPLAVAFSHRLAIPLLRDPQPDCLVVDDIYETGATLAPFQSIPGVTIWTWVNKSLDCPYLFSSTITSNAWILFPWEDSRNADDDATAYHASRQ
jgi:hypoxanthine phosphoribosyltransferase